MHNDGMRTFTNKNISLIILINLRLRASTAQMQTEDKMQIAHFLRILYSRFLYWALSALVCLKYTAQVSQCMVISLYKWNWEYDIRKNPAFYILPPGHSCCFDQQVGSSEYIQLPILWASTEERVHSPIESQFKFLAILFTFYLSLLE